MNVLEQLANGLAGRYTIERQIGRGGMATVYLATDVKHNRRVALKVLDPELGAVLGVERFLAEIQVTANLQHPNLLPLFDSGEADGLLFYVMPYIEGEGLRDKLQREKQLPIEEAIHITVAVASALDYAHRHGVIHRDLKPENILLQEGQPMVADFGIALAVSNAGGNRITQTGLSLGTPQYMSPEQATGDRVIDGRTDIYSLGAMLYEMLTGEPPHTGNTAQSVIAKVITDRPRSIRLARDTVPEHIEAAVERALAKLPADRFATAHEFSDTLVGKAVRYPSAFSTTASGTSRARSGAAVRARAALPWLVTAGALGAAAFAWATRPVVDDRPLRYELSLPANLQLATGGGTGSVSNLAISPGGRHVVYAVTRDSGGIRALYLRSSEDLHSREITGTELGRAPFFSPDGQWIGFQAGGQLRKVAVNGGGPIILGEVGILGRASWSPNGRILFASAGGLFAIPEAGGSATKVASPDTALAETEMLNPLALADGKHALYTSLAMGGPAAARIGVLSLEDGRSTILEIQGSYPLAYVDGHVVYTTAGGTILAAPVDLDARTVTGAPIPLGEQVAVETGSATSYAYMAQDGSFVYLSALAKRRLMRVTEGADPVEIISESDMYLTPRLSPNGQQIALTRPAGTRADVYIYDLPNGPLARLTREGTMNDRPEWMPGGREVLFRSNRSGLNSIWVQPVDGSQEARLLFEEKDAKIDEAVVSPDGKWIMYQRDRRGRGEIMYRALTGDTTPRRVGSGAFGEVGPRFSPDGKWVTYASSEPGVSQVFVRPFPALNARYQISLNGGTTPLWSPDGKTIYYAANRQLVAATIGSLSPFTISSRRTALGRQFTYQSIKADYDLSRDGRTIFAMRPDDELAQIVVVRNWRSELQARLRGSSR